ncbi:hypothetical protein F4810DRAFT_650985 [Camillea tinctor]|nr:hypothetical protein F4810DRAFT_650985 [Camillea tinctor]
MSDDLPSIPEVDSTEAVDCPLYPRQNQMDVSSSAEQSLLMSIPMKSQFTSSNASEDRNDVDGLVHHMRRQTLIPDVELRSPSKTEPDSKSSIPPEHHQQRQFLLNGNPDQSDNTPGEQHLHYPAANDTSHTSIDTKKLRRQTETRHYKSSTSLRSLSLVTDMIENGVQCNVRGSTPSLASQPLNTACTFPIEARNGSDLDVFEDAMNLEIDLGYREQDDKPLLDDAMILRQAGAPAGINKFGFLRYRSSTEAALSCKNMKRSVPRMRRRRRNKTPTPPSVP